jgi:hypothetical protein
LPGTERSSSSARNGEGDSLRTIADSGWNLAWSPDGSKLAFYRIEGKEDYRQEIVVFDLLTERRTTLTSRPNHPISAVAPVSGRQLALFLRRRGGESHFVRFVRRGLVAGRRQLAFVSGSAKATDSASADGSNAGLWIVAADGGRPHLVATGIYGRPSWGSSQTQPKPRG